MLARARGHVARHVVSYLALVLALAGTGYAASPVGSAQLRDGGVRSADIADGTVASRDIRNGTIRGVDVAKGTLRAAQIAPGARTGAAGPVGAAGATGPRGPRFGDGIQLDNVDPIACNTPVTVGSMPVRVGAASRIWASGHGTLLDNGSAGQEYGMWLELRDATDATTLAVTPAAWDDNRANAGADDAVMPLAAGGTLQTGLDAEDAGATPYLAAPGAYVLRLVVLVIPTGACGGTLPKFGYNQGNGMGYMLLAPTS
jgi:hypothetical protein